MDRASMFVFDAAEHLAQAAAWQRPSEVDDSGGSGATGVPGPAGAGVTGVVTGGRGGMQGLTRMQKQRVKRWQAFAPVCAARGVISL
ncbi:hypothetical protein HaLaN_31391, partial [Haematococcus lacustris]